MNDAPSILVKDELAASDRPSWLPDELIQLPRRILFQNEFVGVVLVGLRQGHELSFKRSSRLLVIIAFGRVQVIFARGFRTLQEGGQYRVERSEDCELRAVTEADLLLFVPTDLAANF